MRVTHPDKALMQGIILAGGIGMETACVAEEYARQNGQRATNWWRVTGIAREGKAGLSILLVVSLEGVNGTSCLHFPRHDIKF